jgi:hypothetical protein
LASQQWMFDGFHSRITPAMADSLSHPPSLSELHKALMEMAKGKSPSPDGLTVDLYISLWPIFSQEYMDMILCSIERGSLPPGTTEGLITLLYKGGARNTLNNWQPITLLNVSYKFFAKALQMHLQPVLMELISHDQSAFLPMRFILDTIFLTQETITHAKQSAQALLFLKLDFLKAYDKVDLKFLFLALQKLGFPELFIGMVQLLFQ